MQSIISIKDPAKLLHAYSKLSPKHAMQVILWVEERKEAFKNKNHKIYTYKCMPTYPEYININYAMWHRDRMMGNGLPELVGEAVMLSKLADDGFGNLITRDYMKQYQFDTSIEYMQ